MTGLAIALIVLVVTTCLLSMGYADNVKSGLPATRLAAQRTIAGGSRFITGIVGLILAILELTS